MKNDLLRSYIRIRDNLAAIRASSSFGNWNRWCQKALNRIETQSLLRHEDFFVFGWLFPLTSSGMACGRFRRCCRGRNGGYPRPPPPIPAHLPSADLSPLANFPPVDPVAVLPSALLPVPAPLESLDPFLPLKEKEKDDELKNAELIDLSKTKESKTELVLDGGIDQPTLGKSKISIETATSSTDEALQLSADYPLGSSFESVKENVLAFSHTWESACNSVACNFRHRRFLNLSQITK